MPINREILEELEDGGVATLEPQDYLVPPQKKPTSGINRDFLDSLETSEHKEVTENKAKAIQSHRIGATPIEREKPSLPDPQFPGGTPRDIKPTKKPTGQEIGFWEAAAQDIRTKVPFSPAGAIDTLDILLSAQRLQKDEYEKKPGLLRSLAGAAGLPVGLPLYEKRGLTPEVLKQRDIKRIETHLEKMAEREKRGYTFMGKVGAGVSILPAWMIEFAATGGLKQIGSKTAKKFLEKHTKRQLAIKLGAWTAGAATRTTLGMPHRVSEAILKRQLAKDPENWATSITKGWGTVFIEAASEEAGATITKGLTTGIGKLPFGGKFINALSKAWTKLSPDNTATKFAQKIFTKAGYSNIIGEIGEERLATIMHSIAGTEDFGAGPEAGVIDRLQAGLSQDIQNFPVEAIVLSVPGAGRFALGKIAPQPPVPAPEPTAAVRPRPSEQISPPEAEITRPEPSVKPEIKRKPLPVKEVTPEIKDAEAVKPPTVPAEPTVERKVFYHGTTKAIATKIAKEGFVPSRPDMPIPPNLVVGMEGIYLSPTKYGARKFAKTFTTEPSTVIEATVNLKNPFVIENLTNDVIAQLEEKYVWSKVDHASPQEMSHLLKEGLQEEGYDGVIVKKWQQGGIYGTKEAQVIAFDSKAIDLAKPTPAEPTRISTLKAELKMIEEGGFERNEMAQARKRVIEKEIAKLEKAKPAPTPAGPTIEAPVGKVAEIAKEPWGMAELIDQVSYKYGVILDPSRPPEQSVGGDMHQEHPGFIVGTESATDEEILTAMFHEIGHLVEYAEGVPEEFSGFDPKVARELATWQAGIDLAQESGFNITPELIKKVNPAYSKYIKHLTFQLAAHSTAEPKVEPELTKKELRQREIEAETEEAGISPRRRNRLVKETEARIAESDIYQAELEGVQAKIGAGYYFVPEKFRSEVEDIIGKRKGFPTKAQAMFTFDPYAKKIVDTPEGKAEIGPLPWDTAVQEALRRGKEGVEETWGQMDISDFVQQVKDSVEAEEVGGLDKTALDRATASGDPYLQYLITKQEMLRDGKTVTEIDEMTKEWAEHYGLDEAEIENEFLGPEPLKLKQIKKLPEVEQDKAIEALARENVLKNERQEAKRAVNEVLKANDIEAEVEEVAEIEEGEEIPFERRGRPVGAAIITPAGREIVQLAYGADSTTGYHEAYHTLRRHLTPKDRKVLDMRFKGDQEAEAREFAEFAKTGKPKVGYLRAVWRKLVEKLKKIKSALQGRGYRTTQDIFGEIQRGVVPKEGVAPGAVQFERGVFGQPIEEQLRLPFKERLAAIKKVALQEAREKIAKRKAKPEAKPPTKITSGYPPTEFEFTGRWSIQERRARHIPTPTVKGQVRKARKFKVPIYRSASGEEILHMPAAVEISKPAKPYEKWRPKGVVPIKTKLIKAVDAEIQRTMKPKSNTVNITPEQINTKLGGLFGGADLFYDPRNSLAEVQEAFTQLVKGGPLIQFETTGDRLIRESIRNAQIKAEKARLKAKVKPKVSRARLKLKIQDHTEWIKEEWKPEPTAPKGRPTEVRKKRRAPPVSDKELTEQIYKANRSSIEAVKRFGMKVQNLGDSTKAGARLLGKGIDIVLRDIHPELKRRLRNMAELRQERTLEQLEQITPWLKKTKQMKTKDWRDYDLAIKSGATLKKAEMEGKYKGLAEADEKWRKVADEIYLMENEVGIDTDYRERYYHRRIKDLAGLKKHLTENYRDTAIMSVFESALQRRRDQAGGRELTIEEQSTVMNNVLRGFVGKRIWLKTPAGAKERTLFAFDEKINRYYHNSREAMVMRIMESNEAIATREFFGKETLQLRKLRAEQSRLVTRLYKAEKQGKKIPKATVRLQELSSLIDELQTADIKSSVGGLVQDLVVAGKIKIEDEYKLQRALEAYFQPAKASRAMQFGKSAAYITHLGNFISAMINLQDYSSILFRSPRHTLPATIRKIMPGLKSKYTQKELGLDRIDYDINSYGAIQKWVFRGAGWKLLDGGMKDIFVDAAISELQTLSKNPKNLKAGSEFMERVEDVFGKDTAGIIKDFQSGKKTPKTKRLAFNIIADRHPVLRQSMTEAYLRANWGRYFYTMKNFALRDLQWHRDEAFRNFRKHPARSVKNLLWLAITFTFARASFEMLRDFLRGREIKPKETVIDIWLNLFLLSRYNISIARRKGWWKGLIEASAPPPPLPERGTRNIPIVGEPYYHWFGEGRKKEQRKRGEEWSEATE